MALMSEERRKEMEEEMSRFELEILAPGETKVGPSSNGNSVPVSKPLSPPPPPPAVTALLPEVLAKAPPPPPPPLSPPIATALQPPPPLPVIPSQPSPAMRFIPHQLQRQPPGPRLPARPNFMGMRGPPMAGPPVPFPPPGSIGPFTPPMGQIPPMGPINPGVHMSSMGPMHPGGHMLPMPPGAMSMPPPMGGMNMGVNLPAPPGFCPPGPPMGSATNMRFESPVAASSNSVQNSEMEASVTSTSTSKSSDSSSIVASAPTIYAAPFVKSLSENKSENLSSISGQESLATSVASLVSQKSERISTIKSSSESIVGANAASSEKTEETVVNKKKEKKKKLIRMAGGQAWEDNSLQDWDNDDFRIFCGDLGNDVTDEVLIRAFSKYPSFLRAKVIRDKRTNKTKGFGFVSFKDPQDFIKAMREMNGRYVGSRPIKLRKSTWRDRNIDLVKKKQKEKEKLGLL